MSGEALVTDDEIAGYFLRFQKAFPVNDEGLALADIASAAMSGDFLNSSHTLKHFRQVLSRTQLAVRARRADWEARGSQTLEESAELKVRRILAEQPKQYLDTHQRAELERLERSALGDR